MLISCGNRQTNVRTNKSKVWFVTAEKRSSNTNTCSKHTCQLRVQRAAPEQQLWRVAPHERAAPPTHHHLLRVAALGQAVDDHVDQHAARRQHQLEGAVVVGREAAVHFARLQQRVHVAAHLAHLQGWSIENVVVRIGKETCSYTYRRTCEFSITLFVSYYKFVYSSDVPKCYWEN